MENWTVRAAKTEDLAAIGGIYAAARHYMASHGNPTQWGRTDPSPALLEEDVARQRLYVLEESGRLCGVFAFLLGEDPTYARIEDGSWAGDGSAPYGTIHRLAGDGSRRGVFARCVAFCRRQAGELRADTHADNHIMQALLQKQGFVRCGTILLADGSPRWAYFKHLR